MLGLSWGFAGSNSESTLEPVGVNRVPDITNRYYILSSFSGIRDRLYHI